jgi:hypothetical protein
MRTLALGRKRPEGKPMQFHEMLQSSPLTPIAETHALAECVRLCGLCAVSCGACADACLAEEMVESLRRCIRLNLDCADICDATQRVLARQLQPDLDVLRRQIDLCAAICKSCGDECQHHANMHEHCRICMQACRDCQAACENLLAAMGGQHRAAARGNH